jgi:hypothetical protein
LEKNRLYERFRKMNKKGEKGPKKKQAENAREEN